MKGRKAPPFCSETKRNQFYFFFSIIIFSYRFCTADFSKTDQQIFVKFSRLIDNDTNLYTFFTSLPVLRKSLIFLFLERLSSALFLWNDSRYKAEIFRVVSTVLLSIVCVKRHRIWPGAENRRKKLTIEYFYTFCFITFYCEDIKNKSCSIYSVEYLLI